MADTQPVPSWADPIIGNKEALEQLGIKFNPVWLNWFLTLIQGITNGSVITHNGLSGLQGGSVPTDQFYHLTQTEHNVLNATQTANTVLAGPATGAAAVAAFRALVVADLANQLVTYAKIQNVSATNRLLGRTTAGAGVIEEVPCSANGRAVLNTAAGALISTTVNIDGTTVGTVATMTFTNGLLSAFTVR